MFLPKVDSSAFDESCCMACTYLQVTWDLYMTQVDKEQPIKPASTTTSLVKGASPNNCSGDFTSRHPILPGTLGILPGTDTVGTSNAAGHRCKRIKGCITYYSKSRLRTLVRIFISVGCPVPRACYTDEPH